MFGGATSAGFACGMFYGSVYINYIQNGGNIMRDDLLLKFKKQDSAVGVTRKTLQRMAELLDVTETSVIHMALARFAKESLPAYEEDDGPLTPSDLEAIRAEAAAMLPKGRVIKKRSLF